METEKEYICAQCGECVSEEDTVWVDNNPYHVECAPEEKRKMKTSELTGAALDWAVAVCRGAVNLHRHTLRGHYQGEAPQVWAFSWASRPDSWVELVEYRPSTDWQEGGPIIEREGIELLCESLGFRWVAMPQKGPEWRGPTPLVAAMRCYVASKLGDEVEIPEELQ